MLFLSGGEFTEKTRVYESGKALDQLKPLIAKLAELKQGNKNWEYIGKHNGKSLWREPGWARRNNETT